MPNKDGTGPLGRGPLTRRGAGFYAGYNIPGYLNPKFGRRLWSGRGRGSGVCSGSPECYRDARI